MTFTNPPDRTIEALLRNARTIAVVGLSDNPQRPSYDVAAALRDYGYRIIPVNPSLAVWEGIRAIPGLENLSGVLGDGEQADIVSVFRQPQHVGPIVEDCIRLKLPAIWLQPGVVDQTAAQRAADAGITVVMDRCIKVERMRLG